jgi:hypothetical protein
MKNNESKKGLGTWLRLEHLLSKVEAVDSNLILRRWRRKKKKRKNEKKEEGREGEAKFQGGRGEEARGSGWQSPMGPCLCPLPWHPAGRAWGGLSIAGQRTERGSTDSWVAITPGLAPLSCHRMSPSSLGRNIGVRGRRGLPAPASDNS